ncbi:hypothetical protein nbrc107697_04840 [Gordonia crocea]|uniref:Uncharacterized protein n=1 Tax=Gordonia crocea TaxID=589162 RepID=A0A7M3SUX1_9ACTN|nr:hypothetical protein nbrc107697_04840 [Gordonia crocea]
MLERRFHQHDPARPSHRGSGRFHASLDQIGRTLARMPDDLYDPTYDNIVVPADAPTVEDILVVLAAKQIIDDTPRNLD